MLFSFQDVMPRGLGHNLLMQFSSLGSSKMELSETYFFDILTIQNDQICYVKHFSPPLYVFFTLFRCWWGGRRRGVGHNLLMQFSSLGSSKMVSPLRGALPNAIEFVTKCLETELGAPLAQPKVDRKGWPGGVPQGRNDGERRVGAASYYQPFEASCQPPSCPPPPSPTPSAVT